MTRVLRLLAALAWLAGTTCATSDPPYRHNRYDYWALRGRLGQLPEPNYLPYLAFWEILPDREPALVLCRWPDSAFPLRYHVAPPAIPTELQDEFGVRAPGEYVAAVHRGFKRWEKAIGRPVRFQAVDDPARATLRVDLRAAMRDAPEGLVGGVAGDRGEHCRVTGPSDSDDQVEIEFALHEVTLYIADSVGLLTPRQVERLATHEIGHVLGASGQHSPMRGDVMFRMADDTRFETLSEHDQNSFRGLYRAPPGTIYARLSQTHAEPLAEARRVPPKLGLPIADERFRFEVQFPRGWQTIQTQRGWVAVDGVSWDYDASLQVIALRGTREASRERQELAYRARGEILTAEVLEIDGQPVDRLVVQSEGTTEETAILDWGGGWVLFVVADCLTSNYDYYQRWFRNVLLSLHPVEGDGDVVD